MKERCFLDTNVLLKIIMENDFELLEKLKEKYDLYSSPNVIEELMFKIISLIISEETGDYRFFSIKRNFKRGKGKGNIFQKISLVKYLIEMKILKILEINDEIVNLSADICLKYNLLPNDAMVAATCLYYGIKKIASFDKDFDDILERIELS